MRRLTSDSELAGDRWSVIAHDDVVENKLKNSFHRVVYDAHMVKDPRYIIDLLARIVTMGLETVTDMRSTAKTLRR
ncbi:hypothetical protein [Cryobacterium sp. N19]|uniref:hypothetical protein n=1 Tax=Cryobacterium sp. N19 TaxID=2048288 RepID=UPI000CE46A5A|nr:hypothetical protein [Cryobacterium sp. N19]